MSALWTTTSAFGVHESCTTVNGSPLLFSRMRRRIVALAGPQNWDNSVFRLEVSDPCSSSSSEASSLIALCEDLDWEACVDALRREASAALVKKNEIELARSKLKAQSDGKEEWDYNHAISELRKQASFQAAEQLAKKLNPVDFEAAVSKLAEHIFLSACQISKDEGGRNGSTGFSKVVGILISILTGLKGWALVNAEEAISEASTAAAEATATASTTTSHVPSWLGPALLGIPVASYLVFNVYRDKVNPEASIMDFFFAMGAMLIVGNLITSATLGVRLY